MYYIVKPLPRDNSLEQVAGAHCCNYKKVEGLSQLTFQKKQRRKEGRGIQFVFLRCLYLWQACNSHSVLRWNLPNHHDSLCSVHSQPDVAISMPFAYNATWSHIGVLRHTSKCFYFDCLWFLAVFLFRQIVPTAFHTGLGIHVGIDLLIRSPCVFMISKFSIFLLLYLGESIGYNYVILLGILFVNAHVQNHQLIMGALVSQKQWSWSPDFIEDIFLVWL